MTKIFIDGSAGTTGLRIRERLAAREGAQLLTLPEELRKDQAARKDALNSCDIAFLCLPDDAAIEAAAMVENPNVVVIDTSTAHRVNPDWTYGLPELAGQRAKIGVAKRIANPGCHATGFIVLTAPLVAAGILPPTANCSCFSLTGYSGGGKKMIAEYEGEDRSSLLDSPRQYGLTQQHKHLKEMAKFAGVPAPAFCPIVGDFYSGMEVTVPVFPSQLGCTLDEISRILRQAYQGPIVGFVDGGDEGGFLSANAFSGKDTMQVAAFGNDDRAILVARYDNLGKGASGAAIQNMNIILGVDETLGLEL